MMQQLLMTIGGSSSGGTDTYWITQRAMGGWDNEYTESVDVDDDGNVYVTSIRYDAFNSGYKGLSLVKLNSEGALQWQKSLTYNIPGDRTYPIETRTVSVNSDGSNIFVTGQGDLGMLILKYTASGVISWAYTLGGSNPNNVSYRTGITSSGDLLIQGRDAENSDHTFISKIAPNGSLTFHSAIGKTSGDTTAVVYNSKPEVDSSGNIHFVIKDNSSPTPGVVKYNSSGVLQTVSDYSSDDPNEDYFSDMVVDSSGNKYVMYRRRHAGLNLNRAGVLKLNSSDAVQWGSDIFSTANAVYPTTIAIHSSGDIISCFDDRRTNSAAIITRHQSDGTLVWKREFRHSSYNIFGSANEVVLNPNGNIVLNCYFNTGTESLSVTAQLPSDGSLTGTYNNFVWADATSISETSYSSWSKDSSSIFSAKSTTKTLTAFTNYTVGDNILLPTLTDVPAGTTTTNYSSMLTSNLDWETGYEPGTGRAFDNDVTTQVRTVLTNDGYIDFIPTTGIPFTSGVYMRAYAANGYSITNTYYVDLNNGGIPSSGTNFVGGPPNFNGPAWIQVATGSGTLYGLRLRLQRSGSQSSPNLFAITIDGIDPSDALTDD